MKRPEYVATVIDGYRKTIDEYLATNKLNVSDETINDLYTIFNRKFTKGLLLGDVGKEYDELTTSKQPRAICWYSSRL